MMSRFTERESTGLVAEIRQHMMLSIEKELKGEYAVVPPVVHAT